MNMCDQVNSNSKFIWSIWYATITSKQQVSISLLLSENLIAVDHIAHLEGWKLTIIPFAYLIACLLIRFMLAPFDR